MQKRAKTRASLQVAGENRRLLSADERAKRRTALFRPRLVKTRFHKRQRPSENFSDGLCLYYLSNRTSFPLILADVSPHPTPRGKFQAAAYQPFPTAPKFANRLWQLHIFP